MTREDAKNAMKEGKKVTHKRLFHNLAVTENTEGMIIGNNGYCLSKHIFWFSKMDTVFDDGWKIIED